MNNSRQIVPYVKFVLISILLCTGTSSAQDELRTNTAQLQLVIEQSIDRIIGELPADSPIVVTVEGTEYEWFFRHRAVEALTEKGYPVSGNRGEVGSGYYIVEIAVEQFGMRYSDVRRQSFFGSRIMTRHAEGDFSVRITGHDRERVVRVSEGVSDVIPYRKRNEVESDALPFARAELPEGSLTERYLGPAVIVAATGMVVYLFFSVRS